MKVRIRTQGMLIFLAILLVIVLSKSIFFHWHNELIDEILDVLGIILVLFGFLLRMAARGYKEDNCCSGNTLVTNGPYALVRNPMYFGTFMIGTGVNVILFSFWTLILFWVVFFLIYIAQIKKEESTLLTNFGETYKSYCKVTPKYFPVFSQLLGIRKFITIKLAWIKKEAASLIAVLAVIIGVEVWEDIICFGRDELIKEQVELFLIILACLSIIFILFRYKKSQKIGCKNC